MVAGRRTPLRTIMLTILLCYSLLQLLISPALAVNEKAKLVDPTQQMSPDEQNSYLELSAQVEAEYGLELFYVIDEDLGGENIAEWSNDFLLANLDPDIGGGILLCCETGTKEVYILAMGPDTDILSNADIDDILSEALAAGINNEDYFSGGLQFLASITDKLNEAYGYVPSDSDTAPPKQDTTDSSELSQRQIQYIFDDADLISSQDEEQLNRDLQQAGTVRNIPLFIKTVHSTGNQSAETFADYFLMDMVGKDQDGIALLVAIDSRDIHISTSGQAIDYLTDQRIEDILDAMIDSGMSEGKYANSCAAFINTTQKFLKAGIPAGQSRSERQEKELAPLDMLVAFGAAGVSGGSFFLMKKHSYKGKPQARKFDLYGHSIVNLAQEVDHFVNTSVTSRIKPKPQKSATSTVHKTGGGTFGGGGRKF